MASVHLDGHESRWDNPPHRSHFCHGCGTIWRPADVSTVGVAAIQTRGKADRIVHAERARVPGGYVLVPRWKIERAAAIVERDGDEHGIGRDLQDMLAAPSQPEDAA
jgi:hypothetical protein